MSARQHQSTPLCLSALAALWALGALAALSGVGAKPPAGRLVGRLYTALDFQELECGGRFDKALVARLTMVCQDCHTLYREPELFGLCRQKCFSSKYFDGCLQALRITDPEEVAEMDAAARVLKG